MKRLVLILALLLGTVLRAEMYFWCGEPFAAFNEAANWTNATGRVENPPGEDDTIYGLEDRAWDLGGGQYVGGWDSTGDWNYHTMNLSNGWLCVTGSVITHSDTINVLPSGELAIGEKATYVMALNDASAHNINVQSNASLFIGGDGVQIYKANITIAPGGEFIMRGKRLSIHPRTAQASTFVNRGYVDVRSEGALCLSGGSPNASFTFRQAAGQLDLYGPMSDGGIPGNNRFIWEGGEIRVPRSMRFGFADAEVAAGANVELLLFNIATTFDFGTMRFGEGSRVTVRGGFILPPKNRPAELILEDGDIMFEEPGVYDLTGIVFGREGGLGARTGLTFVREGNTVTVTGTPAGAVKAGDPLIEFTDACAAITNPACGKAGGWWTGLKNDGSVVAENLSGNCSKLWCLNKFSKGYVYNNEYANYTNHVQNFVGGADIPLNEGALLSISNTLLSVRRNGGSVVTRIAYTWDGYGGCECDDFEMVLTHIRQVAEIYNCFTDVVAAVECGVIGAYGEMHTSRYCGAEYSNRVIDTWLTTMDASIPLLVRGPNYLLNYIGESASNVVYNAAALSADKQAKLNRLGFYNDGYLGTWWDYGTWGAMTREQGCDYLRLRPHLPYGGEFATVDEAFFNGSYNAWKLFDPAEHNLVKEWYDTHLNYLRTIESADMTIYKEMAKRTFYMADYQFAGMPKLDEYEGVDLRTFCRDHMGARFVIRGAELKEGEGGKLTVKIENTGFSSVRFPLKAQVLLVEQKRFGEPSIRQVIPVEPSTGYPAPGETKEMMFSFDFPKDVLISDCLRLDLRLYAPLADEAANPERPRRPFRFANFIYPDVAQSDFASIPLLELAFYAKGAATGMTLSIK